MQEVDIKFDKSFVIKTIRNCGYDNYSAIADIIDNSIEPDVDSSIVKVELEKEGKGNDAVVTSIAIIDDGCGMEEETLDSAMTFGVQTGKSGITNLGMYGTGMKSASLSLGRKMEVFSKTKDSELNYASIIITGDDIKSERHVFGSDTEECSWFKRLTGGNHGTIVKISDLDGLKRKNFYYYKKALKSKLGEYFNKFILAEVTKFYVCGEEVPYIDLMGDITRVELMGEETFDVDGH